MSFVPALILELAVAVAVPLLTLGVAVMLLGRPAWLARGRRRAQPGIQSFLVLCALAVVDLALVFLLPFAGAWSSQEHRYTAAIGLFLAVLALLGVGYAWRRGALRWD